MYVFMHTINYFLGGFLMKNALKRNFEKGQHIYVVDYWGTNKGTQAFEERATILEVDEKKTNFYSCSVW